MTGGLNRFWTGTVLGRIGSILILLPGSAPAGTLWESDDFAVLQTTGCNIGDILLYPQCMPSDLEIFQVN